MMLSIGEVAAATGLRVSALRYYEEVGLIAPAARRGGRRHYEPDVLGRLAIVALCQDAGFSVAEIGELLDGRPGARRRWRDLATRKVDDLDRRIAALRAMRRHLKDALACDCGAFEGCDLVAAAAVRRHDARAGGSRTSPRRAPG